MDTSTAAEQFFTGPDGERYSWTYFPGWVARRFECRNFTLDFPIAGRTWRYVGESIPANAASWHLVGGTREPHPQGTTEAPAALQWASSSLVRRSA